VTSIATAMGLPLLPLLMLLFLVLLPEGESRPILKTRSPSDSTAPSMVKWCTGVQLQSQVSEAYSKQSNRSCRTRQGPKAAAACHCQQQSHSPECCLQKLESEATAGSCISSQHA
jgi:hypothetical protein